MKQDRAKIVEIISYMLDNPDNVGLYPTSTAYNRLEHYIEGVRLEAIGWTHAFCCNALDNVKDPRLIEVPKIISQAQKDLGA